MFCIKYYIRNFGFNMLCNTTVYYYYISADVLTKIS